MNDRSIFRILLSIVLSICIALFAYFLLIHFVVDVDLQKNHPDLDRVNNLLNFYEHRYEDDIFILGSSYVGEGIDAYMVEELLHGHHINRSVYNLYIGSDTPLDRVCEVDNIISSRPKLVVIGLSYYELSNATPELFEDRSMLCFQRKTPNESKLIKEEFRSFFNDYQLTVISQSPFENFFYNRKYLFPSLLRIIGEDLTSKGNTSSHLRGYPYPFTTNFKDPWLLTTNWTESEKIEKLGNEKNAFPIFEDLNPQKKALLYTITKFRQNNISVIILNMPITPEYSNVFNESTRYNFANFLNSTGVPWYDYEREYPSEYFVDNWHMNVAGRTAFSSKVAEILVNHLTNGA